MKTNRDATKSVGGNPPILLSKMAPGFASDTPPHDPTNTPGAVAGQELCITLPGENADPLNVSTVLGTRPPPAGPAEQEDEGLCALRVTITTTECEAAGTQLTRLLRDVVPYRLHLLTLASPAGVPGPSFAGTEPAPAGTEPSPGGLDDYQARIDFIYRLLQGLRFEIEESGVHVAFEAPVAGWLASPPEVRELVDAVNSPAIGVCLNMGSAHTFAGTADWIRTLTRRLFALRFDAATPVAEQESHLAAAFGELRGVDNVAPVVVYCGSQVDSFVAAVRRVG